MANNAYIKFNKSRSSASKASLKGSYLVKIDSINPLFNSYAVEEKERIDFLASIRNFKPQLSALEIYKQRSIKNQKVGQEDASLVENANSLSKSIADLKQHQKLFKEKQDRIDRINKIKQEIQNSGEQLAKARKEKQNAEEMEEEEEDEEVVVQKEKQSMEIEDTKKADNKDEADEIEDIGVLDEAFVKQMNAAEDECGNKAEEDDEVNDEPEVRVTEGKKKQVRVPLLGDNPDDFEVEDYETIEKPKKIKKS